MNGRIFLKTILNTSLFGIKQRFWGTTHIIYPTIILLSSFVSSTYFPQTLTKSQLNSQSISLLIQKIYIFQKSNEEYQLIPDFEFHRLQNFFIIFKIEDTKFIVDFSSYENPQTYKTVTGAGLHFKAPHLREMVDKCGQFFPK